MSQTIYRAARRDQFVIVSQSAVEGSRLSWAARGLLAYLLSRPDDWKVLVNDLKRRGNLGGDGIYTLLRELRRTGYIHYEHNRDNQGRLRGGTYFVSEIPPPHPDSPFTDRQDTAAPHPAKPETLLKTDKYLKTTTTTPPTNTYTVKNLQSNQYRLRFPSCVPQELRTPARQILSQLNIEGAQMVIDEWAGGLVGGPSRAHRWDI